MKYRSSLGNILKIYIKNLEINKFLGNTTYPNEIINTLWLLAWCFCRAPKEAMGGAFDSSIFLKPLFSSWIALPIPNMWLSAQSYCNLLCHVCLIPLRGLLFSEGGWRRSDAEGDGR